jgi:hypothetical protein
MEPKNLGPVPIWRVPNFKEIFFLTPYNFIFTPTNH